MAGFIRRFTSFPALSVLQEIEGVDILDLIPQGVFTGLQLGTVCLVGEWPGGPVNTPTVVEGDQTLRDFGGFHLSCVNPLSFAAGPPAVWTNPYSNGNAFCWLKGKRFRRLVLVRVDMALAEGVHIQLTGTPTPLVADLVIPAGTRVRDASAPNVEFALAYDVVFAAGTDLTAAANTAFDVDTPTYATRTVADVPVYSVRGVAEGIVGDVDTVDVTDLFRAGIGAGTSLPSIVVAASTGALDAAAANAAALTPLISSAIDTRYTSALTATLPGGGDGATDLIREIASARQSAAIRTALLANAAAASSVGTGRRALLRAPIGTASAAARGSGDPGVGANRGDRAIYCYPHFSQRIPELAELDPTAAISPPEVLIGADAAAATILSLLGSERNPGQSTQEVASGGLLSFIRDLETGLVTSGQPTRFQLADYVAFKAAGIMALRRDPRLGEWIFQSGVTSVDPAASPTLVPVSRRRMADELQDDMATIAMRYNKMPSTVDRFEALIGELTDYLEIQLSTANPAAQRIAAYAIDPTSGNTAALQGQGIRVIIIEVQLLDTLDKIVLQTTIGATVEVSAAA